MLHRTCGWRCSCHACRRIGYVAGARLKGRPVYAKQANAFVLTGVNAEAAALGLHAGQALADARAIYPALSTVEAEPEEDARVLDALAAWCERFTPVVVVDAPDGLFLDITGCGHLFGGDEVLRDEIVTRLKAQGFAARAAIADTPGAAWALARYGSSSRGEAKLLALPIEALRLDEDAAALLRRLGLKTISQLIAAPRAAFTARAGQKAMLRLDQALGRAPEALSPRRPPPPVSALRRFLEPLFSVENILIAAQDLCADVVAMLERRGGGARACALHLYGLDGRDRVIEIGTSRPQRDGKTLLRLLREKLSIAAENLDAEFGIEAARLDVVQIERIDSVLQSLVAERTHASAEEIDAIVDLLSARLGAKRVLRAKLVASHQPERAGGWVGARLAVPSDRFAITTPVNGGGKRALRRPLTLFQRPQLVEAIATVPDGPPIRFRWRRVLREVVRAEGPERIAGDWLKGAPTRDFYRVEDAHGRRYWLCREGVYGETQAPRWFVMGLFA